MKLFDCKQTLGRGVLTFMLMAVSLVGYGDKVYRSVDAQGNIVFTDTPQPNAQEVTLPPLQSYSPADAVSPGQSPANKLKKSSVNQYTLSITAPQNEANIWDNQGNVIVGVVVKPSLNHGAQLQILVDGILKAGPGEQTSFQITDLDRGSHQIQAQVLDASGAVITSSDAVTIYIKKASLVAPKRPNLPVP